MSHIHTRDGEIDHTASAYIVRTDLGEPKLMLHMHKKLGQLLQFGGHIELTETPWQAVIHEVREESGYDLDQLVLLQPKDRMKQVRGTVLHPQPVLTDTHRFNDTHRHSDRAYAFIATGPPKHKVKDGESDDIRYFSKSELKKLSGEEIPPSVQSIGLAILETYLTRWEQVDPSEFEA